MLTDQELETLASELSQMVRATISQHEAKDRILAALRRAAGQWIPDTGDKCPNCKSHLVTTLESLPPQFHCEACGYAWK